jgi:hypothetical protein
MRTHNQYSNLAWTEASLVPTIPNHVPEARSAGPEHALHNCPTHAGFRILDRRRRLLTPVFLEKA